MTSVFRVFPDQQLSTVKYAEGPYIVLEDGRRYLDTSAGGTSYAVVGWNHPDVNHALKEQIAKFSHVDYKSWDDPNLERLASLLLSRSENHLDKVYFSGSSGSEACEAAMKMSYQYHYDQGHPEKKWFISREQSYHGSTSDALVLGERPNLEFFRPMLSPYRARIAMHHPLYCRRSGETLEEYGLRSAQNLEEKILEIGPDSVAGFVGETIMGGLVGDVPPAPNYWQAVREVCTRYNVHLILDEVYCGTGTSGRIYCCDWDKVSPDFLFIGKTLAAGYGVLSAVLTTSEIEQGILRSQKRLQHTTTHQGHSLSTAAALAVQEIIHSTPLLASVHDTGEAMRSAIKNELGEHEYFRDVRGRGLRFSFEYQCNRLSDFSAKLADNLQKNHSLIVNCKWHRACFTPSLLLSPEQAVFVVDAFCEEFRNLASSWK